MTLAWRLVAIFKHQPVKIASADKRAAVLGIGAALVMYYGLAALWAVGGAPELNRPLTWIGLILGGILVSENLPSSGTSGETNC